MGVSDRLFRQTEQPKPEGERVTLTVTETDGEYLIHVPKSLPVAVLREKNARGGVSSVVVAPLGAGPLRIAISGPDSNGAVRSVEMVSKPVQIDLAFRCSDS